MKRQRGLFFTGGMILAAAVLGGSGCSLKRILPFEDKVVSSVEDGKKKEKAYLVKPSPSPTPTPIPTPTLSPTPTPGAYQRVLDQAAAYAVQYDYDNAVHILEAEEAYASSQELQDAAMKYRNAKAACVEYPLDQITHIFFHTLIVDTSRALDGDEDSAGYNQVMTTVKEFNAIMQSMYDRGYVLVSPHDMASVDENGTVHRGKILLPQGKTPFVLSQDDVSYYHYMDGDGLASRLVLTDSGEVKCEYVEADGTVSIGDYDMVPLLDTFIRQHPDFSYHGRKGILAMTGYNGVLGYRTDIAYKTRENLQDNQRKFLEAHPDFDYDKECQDAKRVADVMKAQGWEFASHTWGHRNATESSAAELQADNEKWEAYVAPILGRTDMIIFAFGADIGDWQPYAADNDKFVYYKSRGYHYYCNVDSSRYWVQITDRFFRQGRRNLDGYRMYYNPAMCSDLFDVRDVWDYSRPTPVPPMGGEDVPPSINFGDESTQQTAPSGGESAPEAVSSGAEGVSEPVSEPAAAGDDVEWEIYDGNEDAVVFY